MSNNNTTPTYRENFQVARASILEILKNEGRMSSSALYAKINYGEHRAHVGDTAMGIHALNLLIKEGLVTDTHEMVDGYISTHFHTIA